MNEPAYLGIKALLLVLGAGCAVFLVVGLVTWNPAEIFPALSFGVLVLLFFLMVRTMRNRYQRPSGKSSEERD